MNLSQRSTGNNLYDEISSLIQKELVSAKSAYGMTDKDIHSKFMPAIFAYFADYSSSSNHSPVSIQKGQFKSVLLQLNLSYKLSASPYAIEQRPTFIQVLHLFRELRQNQLLKNYLSGRYPLKVVVNIKNATIVARIENREQFATIFAQLYLQSIRVLRDMEDEDNIEYYEAMNGTNIINSLTISFTNTTRIKGNQLPKKLKLPSIISTQVINPNNEDKFCLIWCILIAKFKLYQAKDYTRITSLNDLKKWPILQEKFDEYKSQFSPLYANDNIPTTDAEINQLETIFDININLYALVDKEDKTPMVLKRSSFKNTKHDQVARLLFVPYSLCDKVKPNYNVDEYKLGSQSKADFEQLVDKKTFLQERGHFTLIPQNSTIITSYEAMDTRHVTCPYCDGRFTTLNELTKHTQLCKIETETQTNSERVVNYEPNPAGSKKEFAAYHALSKSPFIVYADTETNTDNEHKLFAYRLFVKHAFDPSLNQNYVRCAQTQDQIGEYLCQEFMSDIFKIRMHFAENVNKYKEMDPEERLTFESKNPKPTHCTWCHKEEKKDAEKTQIFLHHDHNKPKDNIVAWICNSCNQKETNNNKSFSIVFHNLPYDLLVLIKSLKFNQFEYKNNTVTLTNEFKLIAKTSMKYSSLTIKRTRAKIDKNTTVYLPDVKFTDSYAFVNMSLGAIVDTLKLNQSNDDLKKLFANTWNHLQTQYPEIADELLPLSTEKGIIAYDSTTLESMASKTNLPIESYTNSLDLVDDHIKPNDPKYEKYQQYRSKVNATLEKDYARSNKLFDLLKKTLKDKMSYKAYFLFYLELDIFLLADFFEFFRDKMMLSHKLDPAHFVGLPGFSQNAMLFHSKKTLHLIPENVALSQLISRNLRGGFSGIINKISDITNDESKYISAIDINNLYGWAMCQKIANEYVGEVPVDELKKIKKSYSNDGDFAYFLLCDYTLHKAHHDKLAKLPPLISKKTITRIELSEEQLNSNKEIKANYNSQKLCATLEGNQNILISYDNYRFYESLGYKFTIHNIYKFKQEHLFQKYIDMNTSYRQKCSNELEKNLYKLLNNIIFGKSLQRNDLNTEGEIFTGNDLSLVQKRLLSPLLKHADIIDDDNLIFTNSYKQNVKFDTAIQNGFHILEMSKLRIYSILYNHIIPFCNENKVEFKILLTDTDSLYIEYDFKESKFESYYDYMKALSAKTNMFDMHSFSFGDKSRKKEVGLFLDEEGDEYQITGLVGLCAKSYCYRKIHLKTNTSKLVIKGKGVRNSYLEALFEFDDYKRCAQGDLDVEKIKFRNISKKDFSNLITETEKVAISDFDDKFFHYKEDGQLKSLPWGHYRIVDIKKSQKAAAKAAKTKSK